MLSISQYNEIDDMAQLYNSVDISTGNKEFKNHFEYLHNIMGGSNLEYAVAIVEAVNFSELNDIQAKLILQKAILLFYYLCVFR